MAQEITVQAGLNLLNGNVQLLEQPVVVQADQTGANAFVHALDIGVSEEDLAFSDIMTPGWAMFFNLSGEFEIQLGPKTGGGTMQLMARLRPGMPAGPFEIGAGVTLRAKAIGGNAKLLCRVLDA